MAAVLTSYLGASCMVKGVFELTGRSVYPGTFTIGTSGTMSSSQTPTIALVLSTVFLVLWAASLYF